MSYNPNLPAGSAVSSSSAPVVIASDQAAVPIKGNLGTAATGFWSSGTTLNTAVTLPISAFNAVSVAMSNSSTMTGGVLSFEVSPDSTNGSNGNWFSVAMARIDSYTVETTYTLSTVANRAWSTSVDGFTYFRVRLSTVIVGTGSAVLFLTPQTFAIEPVVAVGQAIAANLNANVSGTVTATQGTASTTPWTVATIPAAVTTTGDTGAKTTTFNGATVTNNGGKGAFIVVNVGTVSGTTPTMVCKLQGSADSGTTWLDLPGPVATATLTATGTYGIIVYPGLTPVAASATSGTTAVFSGVLPKAWRIVYTIAGTSPSFTLTNVQVSYLS